MILPECPTPELPRFLSWWAVVLAARVAPALPYMCVCGDHWHQGGR